MGTSRALGLVLLIAAYAWLVWDPYRQELWDKLVSTVVVDDPFRQLAGAPTAPRFGLRRRRAAVWTDALGAQTFNRAVDYLNMDKPDIALSLLRQGVDSARRQGDRAGLEQALKLLRQAGEQFSGPLARQAADVARSAREGLRDLGVAPPRSR